MTGRYKSSADAYRHEGKLRREAAKYAKYLTALGTDAAKNRLINNGSYSYRKVKQKGQL